jgi:hypothetical protein
MQKGVSPEGRPMTTMGQLYMAFEKDFAAVAKMTFPNTNTGIVFAQCLDAVEQLKAALRKTAEAALAAEPEPAPAPSPSKTSVTHAPVTSRRVTTKAVARNGGKKPGVGRSVSSNAATAVKRRPGRPKGSRNKS